MDELSFHPAARVEAVRASVYLESARDGYGEKFEDELAQLCERIVAHPQSGTLVPGYPREFDVRAYSMRTFRYSLIVATVDGTSMVYAVAHQHQKPGYWSARLTR